MVKKYEHINFTPPKSAAKAAERGLKNRRETGKGGLTKKQASKAGIGSGVQRAVNLKNRDTMSPSTVKRMKAFFDRHSAYKHKHKTDPKGAAKNSWDLWGGDAGYSWSKKVVRQMKSADEKAKKRD
jgi:hypothetical protein